jgi:hypothetical protein
LIDVECSRRVRPPPNRQEALPTLSKSPKKTKRLDGTVVDSERMKSVLKYFSRSIRKNWSSGSEIQTASVNTLMTETFIQRELIAGDN